MSATDHYDTDLTDEQWELLGAPAARTKMATRWPLWLLKTSSGKT